jgi:hypothetical protein
MRRGCRKYRAVHQACNAAIIPMNGLGIQKPSPSRLVDGPLNRIHGAIAEVGDRLLLRETLPVLIVVKMHDENETDVAQRPCHAWYASYGLTPSALFHSVHWAIEQVRCRCAGHDPSFLTWLPFSSLLDQQRSSTCNVSAETPIALSWLKQVCLHTNGHIERVFMRLFGKNPRYFSNIGWHFHRKMWGVI